MNRFRWHMARRLGMAALGLLAAQGLAMGVASPAGGESGGGGVRDGQEITVTGDQLRLLRHLRVVWISGEAGVPAVDLEMPFGSADVGGDVARILGRPGGLPGRRDVVRAYGSDIPTELPEGLLQAVAVLVDAGKLRPGTYTIVNAMRERIASGKGLPLDDDMAPAIPAAPTFNFTVSTDHLKLFARARFHGFGFDFKRPYGDMTYFELDIADALGVKTPPRTADGYDFKPEEIARFDRLHGEMLFTLQAFLQYAQLEPGTYVSRDGVWTRKDSPRHP
jgi:hypothetical protein